MELLTTFTSGFRKTATSTVLSFATPEIKRILPMRPKRYGIIAMLEKKLRPRFMSAESVWRNILKILKAKMQMTKVYRNGILRSCLCRTIYPMNCGMGNGLLLIHRLHNSRNGTSSHIVSYSPSPEYSKTGHYYMLLLGRRKILQVLRLRFPETGQFLSTHYLHFTSPFSVIFSSFPYIFTLTAHYAYRRRVLSIITA